MLRAKVVVVVAEPVVVRLMSLAGQEQGAAFLAVQLHGAPVVHVMVSTVPVAPRFLYHLWVVPIVIALTAVRRLPAAAPVVVPLPPLVHRAVIILLPVVAAADTVKRISQRPVP